MGILKKLLTTVALGIYMLRYGSIWRLREKMLGKCLRPDGVHTNKLIWSAYGHYYEKRCAFIGPLAKIASEPCFPHGPLGVFISNDVHLGKDCVIFQNVTIGSNYLADAKKPGAPRLGDRVYVGAGAVVYEDMPENSVAACAPTRILKRSAPMDNRHFQYSSNGALWYFENGAYHKAQETSPAGKG